MSSRMASGPLGRLFAPLGVILILVGVVVAALSFIFILLELRGEFSDRVNLLTNLTALPLIVGGAALAWLGR